MKYLTLVLLFTLQAKATLNSQTWKPATDCRANIAAVLCRVNPSTEEEMKQGGVTRACLGGEEVYVQSIERVYDEMDPKVQRVFCSIRRIFVEEQFVATAYASMWPEEVEMDGKKSWIVNGLVVGLSKQKLFVENYDISEWMNRKEQTIFGRKMSDDLLPELVPQFTVVNGGYNADFKLLEVFTHEIGHLMDFTNDLNQAEFMQCIDRDGNWIPGCQPTVMGAFPSISWKSDGTHRAEDLTFDGKLPCYYGCPEEDLHDINQAVRLYRGYVDSRAWVTPYAMNNSMDDWAETFTYFNLFNDVRRRGKAADVKITFPDGTSDSLFENVGKGHIHAKMDFARLFFASEWVYDMPKLPTPMPPSGAMRVRRIPCDL